MTTGVSAEPRSPGETRTAAGSLPQPLIGVTVMGDGVIAEAASLEAVEPSPPR
jgi:hypothetical protein